MKKYKFSALAVEITRRCNKKCPHCVNGDAQNVTISKEIIDRIIDDVDDIKYIRLCGGEVLLEMNMIDYLVQKIISSKSTTYGIELTTNGSICDRKIIDVFEKFCLSRKGRIALIRISNDQFHDSDEYEQAFSFYRPLVDMVNARIKQQNSDGGILLRYTLDEENNGHIPYLRYDGRGVGIVDASDGSYSYGDVAYPFTHKHRIKIVNETVLCELYVSAKGDISFKEEASLQTLDEMAFGNIMDNNMSDLINRHNSNCLLLCSESNLLYFFKWMDHIINRDSEYSPNRIYEIILKRLLDLRYRARALYPNVSAQEIIRSLPFPALDEVKEIAAQIYSQCPYRNEKLLNSIWKYMGTDKEDVYMNALYQAVLTYLKNKSVGRKYPYDLFGDENDVMESKAFKSKFN